MLSTRTRSRIAAMHFLVGAAATAERLQVLRQIDEPHSDYDREMHLLQVTSDTSGVRDSGQALALEARTSGRSS